MADSSDWNGGSSDERLETWGARNIQRPTSNWLDWKREAKEWKRRLPSKCEPCPNTNGRQRPPEANQYEVLVTTDLGRINPIGDANDAIS